MNRKRLAIGVSVLLGILTLAIASAYYPGETIIEPHNLGTDNLVYVIVDNSSELTVLPNVTINSTHIQIYFPANMPPNSFTMVFLEEQTKEVIKEVIIKVPKSCPSCGGGGGGTTYVDKEVFIDVPKYIDREKIVYVNESSESEVEEEEIPKGYFISAMILLLFVLTTVFGLVTLIRHVRRKMKGGIENEEI